MAKNLSLNVASLPSLTQGSTDSASVKILQQALVDAGYMTPADMNTGPGIYGPRTMAAVTAWQVANDIDTQGNYGSFGPVSRAYVTGHQNLESLSPDLTKDEYSSTVGGEDSGTDTTHSLPTTSQWPDGVNSAINNMPQSSFTSLIPQLVPGTPEFQMAMNNIDTSFYDILEQQVNATTEQEHQVADYNWSQLRNYINTNLNMTLSNDSMQAWDQLQGAKETFGQRNLENSGLQNETMDQYLRKVRTNDAANRSKAQTSQDEKKQAYYTQFATPAEIAALISSDPALAKNWGLMPSDGMNMNQRTADMKAKFPRMSNEEISRNLAVMYDENGNYRSALYQKKMTGENRSIDTGAVDPLNVKKDEYGNVTSYGSLNPRDGGILDIQATKRQGQEENVLAANAAAKMREDAAYKESLPSTQLGGISGEGSGQVVRPPVSSSRATAGTPPGNTIFTPQGPVSSNQGKPGYDSLGNPVGTAPKIQTPTLSNPIPAPPPKEDIPSPYTFKALSNGTIQGYNSKDKSYTTGTTDYMKTLGYKP